MTTAPASDSSAPRKRRRRAPATGAADDCFTCRKKQIKCDRRRPYCSQCLEQGKDCSGYKTQLTWGVGVASRGKLRGLSTPVAKQPAPSASTTKTGHARSRSATSSKSGSGVASSNSSSTSSTSSSSALARRSPPMKISLDPKLPIITSYDFVNMDPTGSSSVLTSPEPDWACSPTIQDYMDGPNYCHGLYRHSLQWPGTPIGSPMDDLSVTASTSTGSVSGWSDSDYASPIDYPPTPDEIFVPTPMPPYSHPLYASPTLGVAPSPTNSTGSMLFDRRGPTSCPDHQMPRSNISPDQSRFEFLEGVHLQQRSMGPFNLADVFYDGDMASPYMAR